MGELNSFDQMMEDPDDLPLFTGSFQTALQTTCEDILEDPNRESVAFKNYLAMVRNQQHSQALIKSMYNSKNEALEAQFRSYPELPQHYLVDIFITSERTFKNGWETIKPAAGTKLKLICQVEKRELILEGQVMDDTFGSEDSGFDIVVGVVGPDDDLNGKRLSVSLELLSDPTSANRAIACIEHINRGVGRDFGVDLCHFLLGAPPSIAADKTSSLHTRLGKNKVNEVHTNLCTKYGLNEHQVEAAMGPITAVNGVNLIWGPAGTGKTRTMATSIAEIASLATPVIVACYNNDAVEKALEECLAAKPDLKVVRFVGSSRASTRLAADDSASREDEMGCETDDNKSPLDAIYEQWDLYLENLEANRAAHPAFLFHARKQAEIEAWSNNEEHAKLRDARSYLNLKTELLKAKTQVTRLFLKAQISDLDESLTDYFLQHCVEALFVTCSSAANDQLWAYKPRVCWIDEAAQANVGDLCMAFAPFKNTLESASLAGDFVQFGRFTPFQDPNEIPPVHSVSHFQTLVQDKNMAWPYHTLKVTYRSCPDITRFANDTLYRGQLVNHQSTLVENGLQKTFRQFLRNLNNAWNGELRIAIDVGEDAHHKLFGNTKSLCNEKEAEIIARIIDKLTRFEPVDDGKEPKPEKIMPGDCGVYTAYKGQALLIGKKLRELGVRFSQNHSNDRTILKFCTTTHGAQGRDVNFGFISNVIRDPNDANQRIKFVGNRKNQAVNLTRARWGEISTGNYGDLVAVLQSKDKDKSAHVRFWQTSFKVYRKFVKDVHNRKSIISSLDVEEALLDNKPKMLQASRYRKAHPTMIKFSKGSTAKAVKSGAAPDTPHLGGSKKKRSKPNRSQVTKTKTKSKNQRKPRWSNEKKAERRQH